MLPGKERLRGICPSRYHQGECLRDHRECRGGNTTAHRPAMSSGPTNHLGSDSPGHTSSATTPDLHHPPGPSFLHDQATSAAPSVLRQRAAVQEQPRSGRTIHSGRRHRTTHPHHPGRTETPNPSVRYGATAKNVHPTHFFLVPAQHPLTAHPSPIQAPPSKSPVHPDPLRRS